MRELEDGADAFDAVVGPFIHQSLVTVGAAIRLVRLQALLYRRLSLEPFVLHLR